MRSQRLERAIDAWTRFWFGSRGNEQMKLFRMGIASVLFCCYFVRSFDLDLFYSNQGLARPGAMPDLVLMQYRFSVFEWFPGHAAIWIFNLVFLFSLAALALGLWSRLAAWTALLMHLSFLHRNMAVAIGVDMIAPFYLFYLGMADYRDVAVPRMKDQDLRAVMGSMAYRLCQIQLCVIYGFSGLQKLKGPSWWKGEGIWGVISNPQWARWDFSWAAHFPLALTFMSFACLFWEIYFPVLVWIRPLRYPTLIFGILMHLGIAISINIPLFTLLMVASYAIFLDAEHAKDFLSFLKNRLDFIQVRRPAAE